MRPPVVFFDYFMILLKERECKQELGEYGAKGFKRTDIEKVKNEKVQIKEAKTKIFDGGSGIFF